jgi:hypothetical protein
MGTYVRAASVNGFGEVPLNFRLPPSAAEIAAEAQRRRQAARPAGQPNAQPALNIGGGIQRQRQRMPVAPPPSGPVSVQFSLPAGSIGRPTLVLPPAAQFPAGPAGTVARYNAFAREFAAESARQASASAATSRELMLASAALQAAQNPLGATPEALRRLRASIHELIRHTTTTPFGVAFTQAMRPLVGSTYQANDGAIAQLVQQMAPVLDAGERIPPMFVNQFVNLSSIRPALDLLSRALSGSRVDTQAANIRAFCASLAST